MSSAPSRAKGQVALVVAIVAGLIIGKLIKKATVGIAIGAILGLMVLMILSIKNDNDCQTICQLLLTKKYLYSGSGATGTGWSLASWHC